MTIKKENSEPKFRANYGHNNCNSSGKDKVFVRKMAEYLAKQKEKNE